MQKAPWKTCLLVGITLLLALAFDLLEPVGTVGGAIYVVPVLISLRLRARRIVYFTAGLASLLVVAGSVLPATFGLGEVHVLDRLLAILILWTTVYMGVRIRDREKDLQAIMDTAAEGIITITDNGSIVKFNRAAEQIFGYSAAEILGKNISILMPPVEGSLHNNYIESYILHSKAGMTGRVREVSARRRDGEEIAIKVAVSDVTRGSTRLFTGIVRDISEEKRQAADLQLLWRVVEQSPISIMITDANANIEYVNPAFERITGYSLAEITGQNPRMLKSNRNPPEAYGDLWKTISSGKVWRGLLENRKKDGSLYQEAITICPVHDDGGRATHYLGLFQDVTSEREQARRLEQAIRLSSLGELTGGITHDFKNLMTIILGNLQLLADETANAGGDANIFLSDALSAARDGSVLIRQLLSFVRAGDPKPTMIDVSGFLDDLSKLLARMVPANIRFEIKNIGQDEAILVDRQQLQSAMLNLVNNACDAITGSGRVCVACDAIDTKAGNVEAVRSDLPPGSYIILSVTDTGIGMSQELIREVTKPFYTTKKSGHGTGLGLFMAQSFAQQCGGNLEIVSEPGRGTTVALYLPRQEGAYVIEEQTEIPAYLPRGSETVLIVEDSEKLRRFATHALRRLGYRTLSAANAADALKILAAGTSIDLLFTDIVMPGPADGRQLAREVSLHYGGTRILLTTGADSSRRMEGIVEENYPLLPKPYSIEQIAQSVRGVLEAGRSVREPTVH